MLAVSKWKWFGSPAHFICADRCRFHLATRVGRFVVSSVGNYFQKELQDKPQEIGCFRLFETMVFRAGRVCRVKGCGCSLPRINGMELDFLPANTAGEAQKNHLALCMKYARKQR